MTEPSFKCLRCGEVDTHQPECEVETYRGRCNAISAMLNNAQSDIMRCMDNMGGGYTKREVRLIKIIMNANGILSGSKKPMFDVTEK